MSHLTFPDPSITRSYTTGGITYDWDAFTSKWVINSEAQADFGSLNDVTISASASAGDVIVYDGTVWRDRAVSGDATLNASGALAISSGTIGARELDVTGVGTAGDGLVSDGSGGMEWGNIARDLNAVEDVDIAFHEHDAVEHGKFKSISGSSGSSLVTFNIDGHGFTASDSVTLSGFAVESGTGVTPEIANNLNGTHASSTISISGTGAFTIDLGTALNADVSGSPVAGTVRNEGGAKSYDAAVDGRFKSVTGSSGSSVVTFSITGHGFNDGDPISLSGFTPSALNGDHTVTDRTNANEFTVTLSSNLSAAISGRQSAAVVKTDMKGHVLYGDVGSGGTTWRNTGNWGDLEITASGVVSIRNNVIVPTNLKGITGDGSAGQTIISDGTGGFNWDKPDYSMDDLDDVKAATPADDDILVYSVSSTAWVNTQVSGDVDFTSGSMSLNSGVVEVSNLKISGTPSSGSIVLSDGTGSLKWGPQIKMDDMSDLSVSGAEAGHILIHSGTEFANMGASGDVSISASGSTSINDNVIDAGNLRGASAALGNGADGQLLAATGAGSRFKWITNTVASVDFGGVSNPAAGDALLYDSGNSRWKNVRLTGDVTVDSSGVVGIASGAIKMTSLSGITGNGTANTSFVVSDGSGGFNLASSVATGDVDSLSDVTITGQGGASGGQIFMRGPSAWGNVALSGDATMNASGQVTIEDNRVGIAEIKGLSGTSKEGDFVASDGNGGLKWLANTIGNLHDLSDVESGASNGDVLARGSSKWSGVSLSGDVTATVSGDNLVVTLGQDSVEAASIKADGTASSGAVLYYKDASKFEWRQPRVWENDDFKGASSAYHYGPAEVQANKGKKIGGVNGAKKIHINLHGVKPSDGSKSDLIVQLGNDSSSNTRNVQSSGYTGYARSMESKGTGAKSVSFSSGFVIPFPDAASGESTFTGIMELNLMTRATNGDETWQCTLDGYSVDETSPTPKASHQYGTGTKKITSGLQNIRVGSLSGNLAGLATGSISILYG